MIYSLIKLAEFSGRVVNFLKVASSVHVLVKKNSEKKVYTPFGNEIDDVIVPKSRYCRNTLSRKALGECDDLRCLCVDRAYFWFRRMGLKRYIVERDLKSGNTFYVMPLFNLTTILNLEALCLSINGANLALLIPYPYKKTYADMGIEPSVLWDGKLMAVKGLGEVAADFRGATSSKDLMAFWSDEKLTVVRIGYLEKGFTITKKWNFTLDDKILDAVFMDDKALLILVPGELRLLSLKSGRVVVRGILRPNDAELVEINDKGLYLASSERVYLLEAFSTETALRGRTVAGVRVTENGN